MDIKNYEKILDTIPETGIYVVREDNHEILYFNRRIQEMEPRARRGMTCDGLWVHSCANCPLLTMGDKEENRTVSYNGSVGKAIDLAARKIMWGDDIPAWLVTMSPHTDEVSPVYRKILRVNLIRNSFEIVKPAAEDWFADNEQYTFSQWLERFTKNGIIHPDDTDRFLSFTHLDYLKSALLAGRKMLFCSYRRRSPDGFRWNLMEVVPDSGYTDKEQIILLYIKDVQDMLKESLELDESSVRLQEVTRTLGEQNLGVYAIDLIEGKVSLIREAGNNQEGWGSQNLMWDLVLSSRLARQIHEEDRDKFSGKFSTGGLRLARDEGLQKTDMLCRWKNGEEYRYVAVIAYFGRNQGTREHVVLAFQDVDKRVRQEQALSQRDMQMAAILKSRFGVMTTVYLDSDRCERFWLNENAQAKNSVSGRYTHYYRKALQEAVAPEDADGFRRVMDPGHLREKAQNTQDYAEEICQYRMQRQEVQWLEQHVTYIRRGEQVLVNILGRDITKEKLQEEARLKKAQEQANIIGSLSSMFVSTYYADLEKGKFRTVTQLGEVEKVLGKVTDYMTALRIYADTFVHPEDRADYLYTMSARNLRQVLGPDQPFVTFAYRKHPEHTDAGQEGWIRATAVMAQADSEGKAKVIVYAAQDVTESKRKEMREQRAIQAACEAANHANASKTEFLSRMSHDIRTPMNGIIGMTRIASDHMDDQARVQDCLGKIRVSSANLLGLVNEILDMNDIESGNVDLVSDSFRLSDLVRSVSEAVLPNVQEKGLSLMVHPMQVVHEDVTGDWNRLQQIFLNILGNSVKFTPAGGNLEMTVTEREAKKYGCCSYDFVFTDNGIGMKEEFVAHIFEPFSREEDSRVSKVEGTGLGMTIAQNFVRMMGGSIGVESAPGRGTKVTVTLLLKLQNPEGAERDGNGQDDLHSSDEPFRGFRVLLVEDNVINQEIAMEIIGATGAEVECASDGREGLNRFGTMPEGYFDMIFMDIQMPVMNGYEATRAIRKLPKSDALSVPIVALSANSFAEDINASRGAGMNEHMTKPLEVPQLIAVMSRWLKPRGN
ncbi:MAG: response regulator [Lachnospiraceae bacterium]|nr:response regulator [Lachnospiraceae bacterium]